MALPTPPAHLPLSLPPLSLSPRHACAIIPLCTPFTFLVCECPGKAQIGLWVPPNEQVCELLEGILTDHNVYRQLSQQGPDGGEGL